MKRILSLVFALLLAVSALVVTAAPALACTPGTILTTSASASSVGPGGNVTLYISEQNIGDTTGADLTNVYVMLSYNATTIKLDRASPYFVVSSDQGFPGYLNVLDYYETWRWEVPLTINATTTFTAVGHGTFDDGTGLVDITYPLYPTERSQFTVTVRSSEQGRWTGGGTIGTAAIIPAGVRVTHGFEFHNDLDKPNNFEVNWDGNHFHMTELLEATCWMNDQRPLPNPPAAPVNEVIGTGVGRYNGVEGYTINFHLTDTGEPGGLNDFAMIKITAQDGTVVLLVRGSLQKGNQQAHRDNK